MVKAKTEPSREKLVWPITPMMFESCLGSPPFAGTENNCEVVRTPALK